MLSRATCAMRVLLWDCSYGSRALVVYARVIPFLVTLPELVVKTA